MVSLAFHWQTDEPISNKLFKKQADPPSSKNDLQPTNVTVSYCLKVMAGCMT